LIVMPMALFAVVLMPFGMEVLPLTAMGWGLSWVVAVAEKVSSWSAGFGGVPAAPATAMLMVAAGFLWLTLWKERWRFAGVIPILVAIPVALLAPHPDILVNEAGTAAAVRGEDGRYRMLGGRGATFEIENWLRADADRRAPKDESLSEGVVCDRLGCITTLGEHRSLLALSLDRNGLAEDCRMADVVISRLEAPAGCQDEALVVDRRALQTFGAHALYRQQTGDAKGYRVETAYPAIRRPFMPALPSDQ
jgi:competence protein ComEC